MYGLALQSQTYDLLSTNVIIPKGVDLTGLLGGTQKQGPGAEPW